MKNKLKIVMVFVALFGVMTLVSCGNAGKNESKEKENVVLSEKGKLLNSVSWKLDPNATLKGTTDVIEDTTKIIANIELKDDVKAIADFLSETVVFGIDQSDPTKLSYSRTIGEGFLSTSVLGFWEFNDNETAIIMREWDDKAGKEREPVTYDIVELSAEKLVLQKKGDASPNIYFPK
ncbi:MAG: hypothetical protein CVU05_10230 [Bacteroidetes bacterium HGW-Bacteroidetes-21]|nr:MAG: hypothetical protein CVU05_10230 [Bacteroidetes bacterium HGW-Bacteroidetes-21]